MLCLVEKMTKLMFGNCQMGMSNFHAMVRNKN